MKLSHTLFALSTAVWSSAGLADCLSGDEIKDRGDVVLTGQTSSVHKKKSVWRIQGQNPYTANNIYNDAAIKISSGCTVVNNLLALDFSVYGLGYYSVKKPGPFEEENNRAKALIEQVRLTYFLSDTVRIEAGKLSSSLGALFLKSPATLLSTFYAATKPTRLYDPAMKSAYQESYWGGRISKEYRDYTLSLTVAPKLTNIKKYYESSTNWSPNERSNSSERYLLSYTDRRIKNHTPTVNVLLGDSPSIAVSDTYNHTSQLMLNAEFAYHTAQQWRHFSSQKKDALENWQFPSSLYSTEDKQSVELAIGGQYTTDNFNIFGVEYYFQSEGYSKSQWGEQTDLVKHLNKKTGSQLLDEVFDSYKYLMGSEISNTTNKGMLQGKHYLNTYASLRFENKSTLQPWMVVNVVDGSALLGTHYALPLKGMDERAEVYTGMYSALGSSDSEFALFGETLGIYAGFKYHL